VVVCLSVRLSDSTFAQKKFERIYVTLSEILAMGRCTIHSFIHSFIWFEQYSSGHKGYKNTNICLRTKYKTST